MQVAVLGPLIVTVDGRALDVGGGRSRSLVALLALHAGAVLPVERCIDGLWGDDPPRNGRNALQARVSQLRRVLGKDAVTGGSEGYRLAVDADDVDARRFERLVSEVHAHAASGEAQRVVEAGAQADALWRGSPLADVEAGFADLERTRLEELRVAGLERVIEARLELGDHEAVAGELPGLVGEYAYRERLWALLMVARYRCGRQADALAAYRELRALLAEDLGLDPSPELQALEAQVLAQDPRLAAPAGGVRVGRSTAEVSTGIGTRRPPRALSSFVGRQDTLDALAGAVRRARLVTLTGPGGVGKTRLAQELCHRLEDVDVVFVPLATVGREDGIVTAVAEALGLRDVADGTSRSGDRTERITAALAGRDVVVVIDNCEQVAAGVARFVEGLLSAVDGPVVLATSRQPVGVPGEQQWPVESLSVPPPGIADPDAVMASEACSLFAARARSVDPGFELDGSNSAAVAEICRRLDGIPLAIELAAARLGSLTAGEVADRLGDRFRLLIGGSPTALPRQQTLAALVGWSYELLFSDEQQVFEELSVFVGGASLDQAEAFCASVGVPAGDVMDLLDRLVAKSLLVADRSGTATRYRMLETIREYAVERLAERGGLEAARRRHAVLYASLARQAQAEMRGEALEQWLQRLDEERHNLTAALEWTVESGDGSLAVGLVADLGLYWTIRASRADVRHCLFDALALPGAGDRERALAHVWAALIAEADNDFDRARRCAAAAVALAERCGDPHVEGLAVLGRAITLLRHLDPELPALLSRARPLLEAAGDEWALGTLELFAGAIAFNAGRIEEAEASYRSALGRFVGIGDPWGMLRVHTVLGVVASVHGDYEVAADHLQSALVLTDRLGWGRHQLLGQLGNVRILQGDLDAAERLHREAIEEARVQGTPDLLAFSRNGLGLVARRRGRLDEARRLHEQALEWWSRPGFAGGAAFTEACLGFVAELAGDLDAAHVHHSRSLDHAVVQRDPRAVALAVEGHACVAAATGSHEHAARLLGAADGLRNRAGAGLPRAERADVERATSLARAGLGPASFDRAHAGGATLELEAAVALARSR